jgi:hypothetical protein
MATSRPKAARIALERACLSPFASTAARRSRVVFLHLGKCFDPRGKAETFETRRHIRQRSDFAALAGIAVDVIGLFMAFSGAALNSPDYFLVKIRLMSVTAVR